MPGLIAPLQPQVQTSSHAHAHHHHPLGSELLLTLLLLIATNECAGPFGGDSLVALCSSSNTVTLVSRYMYACSLSVRPPSPLFLLVHRLSSSGWGAAWEGGEVSRVSHPVSLQAGPNVVPGVPHYLQHLLCTGGYIP